MPKEIVLTQITDNPCRDCTYETGRSESCHADCERYARMVEKLEKKRADKAEIRKSEPEFTRQMKRYTWRKSMGR